MITSQSFISKHIDNNHPAFLIIPFRIEDIYINAELNRKYNFDLQRKFQERYPSKYITITSSARKALELVLHQKSGNNQEICIQTTSDNFYISGCVTKTIEQKGSWHRSRKDKYDILLVNHEFGYADNRALLFKEDFWIEDCAFSFNSRYSNGIRCGALAPYSLFSLSKFFPIQAGGVLVSNKPMESNEDVDTLNYINNVVGYYFDKIEQWSEARRLMYQYYCKVFNQIGCQGYFPTTHNDVPGVFLFRTPENMDLVALKEYYWKRGIQCSVFYREQAFYLPLNQFTEEWHVDYFADLFVNFTKSYE